MNNNFIDDIEKINDLLILSKNDFLSSYSYISELEYNNTIKEIQEILQNTINFRKKIFKNKRKDL